MHALLQFLKRAYPFFLFLFLELMCFLLIINHHHYQRISYLHSANGVSATVNKTFSARGSYFSLNQANEQLSKYNQQLLEAVFNKKEVDSLQQCTDMPSIANKIYTVTAAKVINRSVKKQRNYLTLDKGHKHGIKEDMGVIAENGVVGIVKNVSENFATVMPLIHRESRVSGIMQSTNNFGALSWNGVDERFGQFLDVPSYVSILMGDSIFTSGQSSIFPKNIFIGTIQEKNISDGDNFHTLQIDLSTNFATLQNVYVINYTQQSERRQLEQQTINGIN